MATAVSQNILADHISQQKTVKTDHGSIPPNEQCSAAVLKEKSPEVLNKESDQGSTGVNNNKSLSTTPGSKSAKIFDKKNFVEAPLPSKNPWGKKISEIPPQPPGIISFITF